MTGSEHPLQILIAEDNDADVYLVREALDESGLNYELHHVEDGEKAIQFFQRASEDHTAPCPAVLLLDINLPRVDGDEILEQVKRMPQFSDLPVIVITSSDSPADRQRAAELGASSYFRKPSSYEAFLKLGGLIKEVLGRA